MKLQPDVQVLLRNLGTKAFIPFEKMPLTESRQLINNSALLFPLEPAMTEVFDSEALIHSFVMRYRVYIPSPNCNKHLIIFLHGGGWTFGSIDSHDYFARSIGATTNSIIISLDYPLSPEFKYPFAIECLFEFINQLCDGKINVNKKWNELFICGDSAGGNLAAALCLMFSDMEKHLIDGQILIYPVIDSALNSVSYKSNGEAPILNLNLMKWFWEQYLEKNKDEKYANLMSHPLNKPLPPALIITAEYDPLRDEGEAYALKLIESGTLVTTKRFLGVLHGFVRQSHILSAGIEALKEIQKFVNNNVCNGR